MDVLSLGTSNGDSGGGVGGGGNGGKKDCMQGLSELKNLVNEMNQGLEYENLSADGSNSHIRFHSSKYANEFFAQLNEFRQKENFCDVTLRLTSSNDAETG